MRFQFIPIRSDMMQKRACLPSKVLWSVLLSAVCVAAEPAKSAKPVVSPTKPAPAQQELPDVPQGGALWQQDEEILAEKQEASDTVKVARPVSSDPVQVFGWLEKVKIGAVIDPMVAKLDTGATISSIHAENQQVFERDGKKWVRFVVTDPNLPAAKRFDMEAPLTRSVMIKDPGGESTRRNVVRLTFQIGERTIKAEFTLNNRKNMSCPVLIGRSTIQVLGWVDPSRTYLADDKIMR